MSPNDFTPLVNELDLPPTRWLEVAQRLNLSDIHLTPQQHAFELEVMRNGQFYCVSMLSLEAGMRLRQRIKSTGKLNIAENKLPQDGRIDSGTLQARLATHPSLHGEAVSIRLLQKQAFRSWVDMGLVPSLERQIDSLFHHPEGLLLVSGPTGSGKTTLLHTGLQILGPHAGRIATLEDPVEIHNEQALQTDLSTLPGLTFAQGLRSLMRQNPTTLLVGEVRDQETAELCLSAALTGHRVLATVHALDCMGTLHRLQELGVSLNSLLNCLTGVINLRLNHHQVAALDSRAPQDSPHGPRLTTEIMNLMGQPKHALLSVSSLFELHQLLYSFEAAA